MHYNDLIVNNLFMHMFCFFYLSF